MIRRPPRSTHCISSAASDVYKRQVSTQSTWGYIIQIKYKIAFQERIKMAEIKLLTIDGKEISYSPNFANFSDTIQKAYSADPTKAISVIFNENTALIIKKYLEDHEYNNDKMIVKIPPRSWEIKDILDEIAQKQFADMTLEKFKQKNEQILDQYFKSQENNQQLKPIPKNLGLLQGDEQFEILADYYSPIIMAAESIHFEKLKLVAQALLNCYVWDMVNEEDEDDIRCKAGMTLLYLGEEQNEKGETVRDLYYFPRKLPLEYEEKLNKEIEEGEKNIKKIYEGEYFPNAKMTKEEFKQLTQ
eukprot:TRINITY_DN3698_c0_g1_i2.p1 TRINITY_DN3698_c0_g1~~TRINITY_DN3698_c0_g1_i2.p1  ORF type:complete len:302 (-),score=96.26 TRINITY_DN3698_c0_g1_i2:345-1250(-)